MATASQRFRDKRFWLFAGTAAAVAAVAGFSSPALAQDTPPPQGAGEADGAEAAGEQPVITVTARRRDESIVDVPLAITVVSGEKLDKLNIRSTTDLANFVPGLQFSDFTPGNSRNDRGGNRPLIFRGLNLSRNGGTTGAGSMFLDGAAVIGNEIPGGYDIGAVEVLRGPQNVYFGRASMTGAVSYRTRAIPDELTLDGNVTIAERGGYRFEASAAGMIAPGILGARLTGLLEKTGGFITNDYNPSGKKFGERKRRSVSGTIEFTPVDALEVKLYANYFEDEDGVSATIKFFPDATISTTAPTVGKVLALGTITNCLRGIDIVPAVGATQFARPTVCGKVPKRSLSTNYARTDIPPEHAASLFSVPFLQNEGFKKQVGLQRNVFNAHGVVNLQINDYLKAQAISGYHTNAVIQAIDGIGQPVQPLSGSSILFFGLSNKFRDFSQEVRLSSDPERAFSWTVGANYVNAKTLNNATNTRTTNTQPTAANPNPVQTYAPLLLNVGDDRAKTYGVFAGAYLKLLDDRMTLSAEGRYQTDKRSNTQRVFTTGAVVNTVSGSFDSFNPRFSVDYDVGGGRKVYASYARGSRPGGFNNGIISFFDPNNPLSTPAVRDAIQQTFGLTDPTYDEEQLTIYEAGFKGFLNGGKGYFDINVYYGTLNDQQVTQASLVPVLNTTLSLVTNTGKVELYGVEFSGNYNFTRQISLNTTFAYNQTKRQRYIDPTPANVRLYGFTDYSGLELPNAPEISGSAVLSYEEVTTEDWSPFANAAFVYRGRQWADIANFAYIPGRATLDLRVGAKNETFRVEAFVTNLFNNKTYPGGNIASEFGGNPRGSDQGFFGAYADPQTFGLRLTAHY